jgi:uncharacterized protein YjbJ (UPF0337 family)
MSIQTSVHGNWHELKGLIKEKWGQLTDDEIETISGKKEKLVGSLMAKYSMAQEKAEEEVGKFWQ